VRLDGRVIAVPPGKQRVLLAFLALHAPRSVSADAVIDAVWPNATPARRGL
jgi:DNA-binding SARP family transcriptional activator